MRNKKETITDIDRLEAAQYPLIAVNYHGSPALVKCRLLTSTQIQACGEFSLIQTEQDRINQIKKLTNKEIIEYANTMHNIVKESLVQPTYGQIMDMVQANELCINTKKKLEELRLKCQGLPFDLQRKQLEDEIDKKRIWVDLILPEDFLSGIFCYALDLNRSDIKRITEEMLLNAAVLAEKWHKAPHEYITGMFTDFNKMDIDKRAFMLLYEKRKNHEDVA
jgi:hypothetical protein